LKDEEGFDIIDVKEKIEQLIQFFKSIQKSLIETIKFYSDNGDVVSAVFMLMVFYRLIAGDALGMLNEEDRKICKQIVSNSSNDSA